MNNKGTALCSALDWVGEIPERNALDVKVASPAIYQMNQYLHPGLAANLCLARDLICPRELGAFARPGCGHRKDY